MTQSISNKKYYSVLLSSLAVVFLWSMINPHDHFTWFLEVFPVILGLFLLFTTYRKFPFTRIAYFMMFLHAIILMVGGHYTYAEVPLFNEIRDLLGTDRNHYDRVGHFAQGFFPAVIAREILLRLSPLKEGKWLFFIVVSICLAFSAFYEMIEWWVAAFTGAAAESFLGTQGDVWDTQWDMFLALIGAVVSQVVLVRWHKKALQSFLRTPG
jgi:putative membrane protein